MLSEGDFKMDRLSNPSFKAFLEHHDATMNEN